MRKPLGSFEATVSKRIYRPIITDYDFEKSICELVDNAIDIWIKNNKFGNIIIEINPDISNQSIIIKDNVGGLKAKELPLVVAPGHTSNSIKDETIGIFGIGTKRATVHLAELIIIRTHHKDEVTYEMQYDQKWLEDDNTWNIYYDQVDDIPIGETHIELLKLRYELNESLIADLKKHLSEVYAKFIEIDNFKILLKGEELNPIKFENWSYYPNYEPNLYKTNDFTTYAENVEIEILAGLSLMSSPIIGEYGVYLYCNDRLVAKALKDKILGVIPHPECALAKIFLNIKGPAGLMPWNSSKSDLNTNSEVFKDIRKMVFEITDRYMRLSRSLSKNGMWGELLKFDKGKIVTQELPNIKGIRKYNLPNIPPTRQKTEDKIRNVNEDVLDSKPWTRGLLESMQAVEMILNKSYKQKNRIALILLDSSLEIGLKEYLIFQNGKTYTESKLQELFNTINSGRKKVIAEIRKFIMSEKKYDKIWNKVEFYYKKRCDLIHSTSTPSILDPEIDEYKDTVQNIFNLLFGLTFKT